MRRAESLLQYNAFEHAARTMRTSRPLLFFTNAERKFAFALWKQGRCFRSHFLQKKTDKCWYLYDEYAAS